MKRKNLCFVLAFILLMSTTSYGSGLKDKKDELSNTKQNITNSKAELEQNKAQQKVLEDEIEVLDKQIITIEDKILGIEDKLSIKQGEIETAKDELAGAIDKKQVQYAAMKDRMVHMYKNSKVGYMQIIFSSRSFSDMLRRIQYIKAISEYDGQLLADYQQQEQVIEEKKMILEQEEKNIQTLYAEQSAVKKELQVARSGKNAKAGMLEKEAGQLHSQIEEFEKISKDLEAEIKRLTQQSTVKYNGGAFAWPVPGYYRLSSEYNPRENPITGKNEFHQGIDIPAGYGKSVVAAADGRVITSGWVRGFGNTIMIDHGGGLVTIYGHNSSLTVGNGETVKKGQQVARIGSTGYSTGNHCHFEVRINGRHTNPWKYLNK
ncbi:MAG: murein hydrolase activator EnvC family protein [Cellulosilyticaceae bacterium]